MTRFFASLLWIALSIGVSAGSLGHLANELPWTEGEVRKLEMEGGFFGLFTSDGQQFLPMHLPEWCRQDKLAVRFRYKILTDVASIQQWGTSIVVTEIEPLKSSEDETAD